MRHPVFIATCFFLVSANAWGAKNLVASPKMEKVISAYANSIGCLVKLDRRNIVEYPVDARGERRFVALVGIDPQCSGGSAMYHSALISLVQPEEDKVFVIPAESFPVTENDGLPQYMDRIYVKAGELWFSGKAFDAAKDPLCCPSVSVRERLVLRDGSWSVIRQGPEKQ